MGDSFKCYRLECHRFLKRVELGRDFGCRWLDSCRGYLKKRQIEEWRSQGLRGYFFWFIAEIWEYCEPWGRLPHLRRRRRYAMYASAFVGGIALLWSLLPGARPAVSDTVAKSSPSVVSTTALLPTPLRDTTPRPNPQFEVRSLTACAWRILDRSLRFDIARSRAETSQNERVRHTEQAESFHAQIEEELDVYMGLLDRLAELPEEEVAEAFQEKSPDQFIRPTTNVLPAELGERHWRARLATDYKSQRLRDRVRKDFERNAPEAEIR